MKVHGVAWHSATEKPHYTTNWLLYPFFAVGYVTLLIGEMKTSAKTTFVMSTLARMLGGQAFYPDGPEQQYGPVAYITEQSPETMMESMNAVRGLRSHSEFRYTSIIGDFFKLSWAERVQALAEFVLYTGTRYIVIDTWADCTGLSEEQENHLVNEYVRPLTKLASEQKAAVLIVQHTRKGVKFHHNLAVVARGNTSLTGAASNIALIHNMKGDRWDYPYRRIKMIVRGKTPPPFQVLYRDGRYEYNRPLREEELLAPKKKGHADDD